MIAGGNMPMKLRLPILEKGTDVESFFELLNPEKTFSLEDDELEI